MATPKPVTTSKTKQQALPDNKIKSFPFLSIGFIFILLSLLISFLPTITRGWGFNYIKFFAPSVMVIYYIVLLSFCLPQVNKAIADIVTRFSRQNFISFLGKYKYLLFIVISVSFSFLFCLLKTKYIFLGDLDIRPKQIEEGFIIIDEYLTMQFFKYAQVFLNSKFGYTGIQTIQLFDYIAGGIFIFISLCIANLIGNTFFKKLSVFIVGTLSLTILLQFCGYIEIYALPVLFLLLYLFACILHLKGKVNVFIPLIVLIIGTSFHLMLVCMAAPYAFLFYRSVLWKYELFRKRNTFIALILLSLPVIYWGVTSIAIKKMLPFYSGEENFMTMFSISHFKEFFNSQILASGIGFFIWIGTLIYSLVRRIKYDVFQWFFLIFSLSIVGLVFVFDPHRGSGDWDILAFAAIVYNLSNAYFLLMLHDKKLSNNIKYGILMISGFSIIHTSMWIATNKTDVSINWVERAFEDDPARYYITTLNNETILTTIFSINNLNDKALYWGVKSYNKHRNDPRTLCNYANELIRHDRKNEAYSILEDVIKRFPYYALSYPVLINAYTESNNYNALYNLLVNMEAAYKDDSEAFTNKLTFEQINQYFIILSDLRKQIQQ